MRSIYKNLFIFIVIALFPLAVMASQTPSILVLGDSLSAGYGMKLEQSWPRLLQNRLDDNGHEYRVVNSSITGDTTQGGLTRLPRLLSIHHPDIVVIELGGNDGLRGIGVRVSKENISRMIEQSQAIGARVLLTGIRLPPNYGLTYTRSFEAMYTELEERYGVHLVPFLMDGIALEPSLMQADGIHPNAAAQPVLLDNVWETLSPLLE